MKHTFSVEIVGVSQDECDREAFGRKIALVVDRLVADFDNSRVDITSTAVDVPSREDKLFGREMPEPTIEDDLAEQEEPEWYGQPFLHSWEYEEPQRIHKGTNAGDTPLCFSAKWSGLSADFESFKDNLYGWGCCRAEDTKNGKPPAGYVWCEQCLAVIAFVARGHK